MIKYTKFLLLILFAFIASQARSQSTASSSSPYSRYGLGDINEGSMTQNVAMGGIGTATNSINNFFNINPLNPASYGYIRMTTIDAGIYSNTLILQQTGFGAESNANFRFSHVAFAFPITKTSALAFGLQPYSELGYNYKQSLARGFGTSSPADTNQTNYIYQGEGGLSKAYIGYGVTLFKHLSIGANVSYIFGNLKQTQTTEIPGLYGTLNSIAENSMAIGGINYDYGMQYGIDIAPKKHITLGYSASASSQLNATNSYIVSQYTLSSGGVANVAADSLINQQGIKSKIQLPQINHFGFSYQEDDKFLVGADYTMGKWSNLTIGGVNQGLLDSKTFNVGGQFTPRLNAIGSYWSTVDYRLGFKYDQTYINAQNPAGNGYTNIKSSAVTFGLGMPLRPAGYGQTFYKINLAVELGQRGTLSNGLVKENYINFHLGFMLNDRWFQRIKFD